MEHAGQKKFFTLNTFLIILVTFAVLGAIDASYLTYMSYRQIPLPCTFSFFDGCNEVARSSYSKVFGVPLSLFGVIYYFLVIILLGGYFFSQINLLRQLILPLTSIGFLLSLYFIYIQAFLIGKFCAYCVFSALISAILFVVSIYMSRVQNYTA